MINYTTGKSGIFRTNQGRNNPMKRLATITVAAVMAAAPVMADLVFPSLSYRTGPYAANGIPFADGYADYMTLLNERDGGIGGVKLATTLKKALSAMKPPKAKAPWCINRFRPALHIS
jgi:hypothetical protein